MDHKVSPYEVAKELLTGRFRGAELVFVAGSFLRGEETAFSDIDLVVVYPRLERAYRESFLFNSWPVEAFVHDRETLSHFFNEVDAPSGIPSLPNMVVEGVALPEGHPWSGALKSQADRIIGRGPEKWSVQQLDNARYGITDLLEDLRAPRSRFEGQAVVAQLHEQLGDFWFRAQGRWSASGKQIPRRMAKLNPEFAQSWVDAFGRAFGGEPGQIVTFAEEVLQPYGGVLFDGHRREAPVDWRLALDESGEVMSDEVRPAIASVFAHALSVEELHWKHDLGDIQIRLAEPRDVPDLRLLLNSAYKRLAEMGLNYSATFADESRVADGLMEGATFVLHLNDRLVASVKLTERNEIDSRPCLYMGRFAVDPELQGRGLGLHLLQMAETIAMRTGKICMQLDTAQSADHLLRFYQNCGFEIKRHIYFEGKTYCSWVLEKTLRS